MVRTLWRQQRGVSRINAIYLEKTNNKRHQHLIEMKYRVGENWFKSIQKKNLLFVFPNRHLSQRQVLNFSIKCDEAWEIVNTIMVRLKKNLKSQNYMKIIAKNYKIIRILVRLIQKLPLWTFVLVLYKIYRHNRRWWTIN